MANSYKTPGVYVEEISTLPASVAQVETAIPAFIGYTQKADRVEEDDLILVPTKVSSLVEYEQYFGKGPSYSFGIINLDVNYNVDPVTVTNNFYNYDSIRLFFANGGGDCYIVSIGRYTKVGAPQVSDFTDGLDVIKKQDEPTLLLFPDAALLTAANLASVQIAALGQCADPNLMDRFTIMDVKETPNGDSIQYDADILAFRTNIGNKNLKYGAAYTPYVKVNLPKEVHYRDIKTITKSSSSTTYKLLTSDSEVQTAVDRIDNAVADVDKMNLDINAITTSADISLAEKYDTLRETWNTTNTQANFQALFNFLYSIAREVSDWVKTANTDLKNTTIRAAVTAAASTGGALHTAYSKLIAYDKGAKANFVAVVGPPAEPAWGTELYKTAPVPAFPADLATIFTPGTSPAAIDPFGADPDYAVRRTAGEDEVSAVAAEIFNSITALLSAADQEESDAEDALYAIHSIYKKVVDTVAGELIIMPPSGAIAGIYADVDRSRGVWKAPANVSVTAVTALTQIIDNAGQEDLNVHPTTGKSINAIRAFTGKGILVWGARTLAGNDNEWRYVPVRRLFIMVEESIRKATEFVVFEPNDPNTWTRVRGMINNFLTDLWKVGALAGAKPAHAFFVNVGLGETMTPQDILEGKLIIEIGLAAVRPAEFIILRFSHKLQES